ncbi:hypothetical protein Anas_00462 [Armadillidium nasatum]|uniref:Uncharacterized protein n=1 Tax=Armadillidium nasatum TaxID=96803 RepID=A0A5N5SMR6_9CRUS|nr:hypothetical protein Anas_00462 [Armadillidium nasatum]
MNIESNNLDAVTDHSDTNEELNTDQPVTVKGPIIQIKKNIEANIEDKQCNLNNLVNNEKRKPENSKEIVVKTEHPSSSKTSKDILKLKSRRKSKENIVRVKNKFSETSLEYISSELKGAIFSGWINEREYIDNLKSYRDIVEIDEWESDLTQKLKQVMKGVRGVMEGTKWINITVPSSHTPCYCLWVLLDTAPIPGHYWMQISDITCNDPQFGLKFTLKTIREIHPFDGESKEERMKRLKGEMSPDEWKEWALSLVNFDLKSLLTSTMNLLTPSNIGQGFRENE